MNKIKHFYVVILFAILFVITTSSYNIINNQSNKEIIIYNNTFNNIPKEEINNDSKFLNENIIGYLSIENTNIKDSVTQGNDNEYYLNHNLYNEKDINGVPFLDYRVNTDSRVLLIYGHSSNKSNMPFNYLENYYDINYFKEHQLIYLETENKVRKYKVFSVYVEPTDYTYYNKLIYYDDEEYYNYLKVMKSKSFYDTKVDISKGDNIIILQTCSYLKEYDKYKYKFLLVIGKEVN